jgi:hypothetical protein
MLEKIKTFLGKVRVRHADKTTIVEVGEAWYCTECRLVFITKAAGKTHSCEYRFQDVIVGMRKDAEAKVK